MEIPVSHLSVNLFPALIEAERMGWKKVYLTPTELDCLWESTAFIGRRMVWPGAPLPNGGWETRGIEIGVRR